MKALDIHYTDATAGRGHSLKRIRVPDDSLKKFLDVLLNTKVHEQFISIGGGDGDDIIVIPAHSIIKVTVRTLERD